MDNLFSCCLIIFQSIYYICVCVYMIYIYIYIIDTMVYSRYTISLSNISLLMNTEVVSSFLLLHSSVTNVLV